MAKSKTAQTSGQTSQRTGNGPELRRPERKVLRPTIKHLGLPDDVRRRGSIKTFVWIVNKRGRGMLVARLSPSDTNLPERAWSQISELRQFAHVNKLKPRLLVLVVDCSGDADWERRPDYQILEEEINEGRCDWVAWRDMERLSRQPRALEPLFQLLEKTGTELWIAESPRPVDWDVDKAFLRFRGLMSAEDRRQILLRTHRGVIDNWLQPGRGLRGKQIFGCERDDERHFVQVMPHWKVVRLIHEGFARVRDAGGIQELTRRANDKVAELELRNKDGEPLKPLSEQRVRKILSDQFYVTGEWHVEWLGRLVSGRPVQLKNPISPELFARNQTILAATERQRSEATRANTYALNRILHCPACGAVFTGRWEGGEPTYRHAAPIGPRCLHAVPRTVADAAAAAATLEIDRDADLLRAWAEHIRGSLDAATDEPVEDRRKRLIARLREIDRQAIALVESGVTDRDLGETLNQMVEIGLDYDRNTTQRALDVLDSVVECRRNRSRPIFPARTKLQRLLEKVLTADVPDALEARAVRRAAFTAIFSRIYVTLGDDGEFRFEFMGPLLVDGIQPAYPQPPSQIVRSMLLPELARSQPVVPHEEAYKLKRLLDHAPEPEHTSVERTSDLPAWRSGALSVAQLRAITGNPRRSAQLAKLPQRRYGNYDPRAVELTIKLRCRGWSITTIAKELNRRGIPTPRNATWWPDSVSNVIALVREWPNLDPDTAAKLAIDEVPVDRSGGVPRARIPQKTLNKIMKLKKPGVSFDTVAQTLNRQKVATATGTGEWLGSTVCNAYHAELKRRQQRQRPSADAA